MSQDLTHLAAAQAAYARILDMLRIELPGDAWRDVMLLLQVPEERWAPNSKVISDILTTGAMFRIAEETEDECVQGRKQLAEIVSLARSLKEKLATLNRFARLTFESSYCHEEHRHEPDHVRRRLQYLAMMPTVVDGEFPRLDRVSADLDVLITAVTRHCLPPRRAGRPPLRLDLQGFPRGCSFDLMVCLLWHAASRRGWFLTISPDFGTGSFVDLLNLIEPHVPVGLLPPAPSWGRIRGLRALVLNSPREAEFTTRRNGDDLAIERTMRRPER